MIIIFSSCSSSKPVKLTQSLLNILVLVLLLILNVHPLLVLIFLPLNFNLNLDFLLALLALLHFPFHFLDSLLNLLIGSPGVLFDRFVLLQVLLNLPHSPQLKRTKGQHVNNLQLGRHTLVQLLKQLQRFTEFLNLHQVLPAQGHRLLLVLLPIGHDPPLHLQQLLPRRLVLIPPHLVIRYLQLHIYTVPVHRYPPLHRFLALPLSLRLLDQIRQTHLRNPRISLCDIPPHLSLRRRTFEGILETSQSLSYALLVSLYTFDPPINLRQLHKDLITHRWHIPHKPLQHPTSLLLLLTRLQQIRITLHQRLIVGMLAVSQLIEILSLFVVQLLVFLFCHLEQSSPIEGLKCLGHQQYKYTLFSHTMNSN